MSRDSDKVIVGSLLAAVVMATLPLDGQATVPQRKAAASAAIHKSVTKPHSGVKPSPAKASTARPAAKPGVRPSIKPVAASVSPDAFIPYYNQGRQAYQSGHYADAEKALKKSLSLADQIYARRPDNRQLKNLAIVNHLVGMNAFKLKKYGEATIYLKKAVSVYTRPEFQQDNQDSVMSETLVLGQMAMYEGRYQEAEGDYKTALPLVEAKLGPDHQQAVQTREILGEIAQIQSGPDYLQELGPKVTHWIVPGPPIAVYIADGSSVPGWKPEQKSLVRDAYLEWQNALEDRLQFEFVDDPQQADTVISWMDRPKESDEHGHDAKRELRNGVCQTQIRDNKLMKDDIVVAVNDVQGVVQSANSLHNTLLHEIGHSIGFLGGHSSNPADVMFYSNRYDDGRRKHLTARDINSARRLYDLTPTVSNPPSIHLVPYQQYVAQVTQGATAFNNKNYQEAAACFKNALSMYGLEPDARFWFGLAAYDLKAYQDALPYLMAASMMPGEHQDEALKFVGYTLIKAGENDDRAGAYNAAEQKYQRASQILRQGMLQRTTMKPENSKAIQEQLSWINHRLALHSSSPIQWETAPAIINNGAATVASNEPARPESFKQKLKGWFFGSVSPGSQITIPVTRTYNGMGY